MSAFVTGQHCSKTCILSWLCHRTKYLRNALLLVHGGTTVRAAPFSRWFIADNVSPHLRAGTVHGRRVACGRGGAADAIPT